MTSLTHTQARRTSPSPEPPWIRHPAGPGRFRYQRSAKWFWVSVQAFDECWHWTQYTWAGEIKDRADGFVSAHYACHAADVRLFSD